MKVCMMLLVTLILCGGCATDGRLTLLELNTNPDPRPSAHVASGSGWWSAFVSLIDIDGKLVIGHVEWTQRKNAEGKTIPEDTPTRNNYGPTPYNE